ncbi:MAG: sporulation protein YunB [Clostridium butyricum]|nr:sporulation protein YunB [Clostridium butyricum]
MEYYTRRNKRKYLPLILVIIIIIIVLNTTLIFFDRRIMPSVIRISEIMAKSQTLNIINETSMKILDEEFQYNEMMNIEKDDNGRIILVQVDTAKLNYISSKLSNECNKSLSDMSDAKIKVPIGWLTEKSLFYNFGPKISMEVEPIGNIVVTHESKFESAGINQTRHKIYLNVNGKVRMKLPFKSEEIDIETQVPVADTIIVGEVPEMTIYSKQNE